MLPFIKVFSLIVRAFSRPLINYTKRYHASNKDNTFKFIRTFFIRLGNYYNKMETKINKKFLKIEITDDVFIKPLSDDVAIDKGVEFFYEVIFYSIVLSLPLYEMYIQQVSNEKKAADLNAKLEHLDNEIRGLQEREIEQNKFLQTKMGDIETLIKKNDKATTDVLTEMNKLKFEIDKLIQIQMNYMARPKLE